MVGTGLHYITIVRLKVSQSNPSSGVGLYFVEPCIMDLYTRTKSMHTF